MKCSSGKIPKDRQFLLVSGIPASGKTTFCQYLEIKHGFAHYDLEKNKDLWPIPELKDVWECSRKDFVRRLRIRHDRVALDWGFPPERLSWVLELRAEGFRIVWFKADEVAARRIYINRATANATYFDIQINKIKRSGLPKGLDAIKVMALTRTGQPRVSGDIAKEIFRFELV
jgi:hypothetical protein